MGRVVVRRFASGHWWWDCPCCHMNSYPLVGWLQALADAYRHIRLWHRW